MIENQLSDEKKKMFYSGISYLNKILPAIFNKKVELGIK